MREFINMLSPEPEFLAALRTTNVVIGLVLCGVLLFALAIPRWKNWSVPLRLGWMALFFLCLTGTYGSFEVRYLHTNLRVPMVSVSFIWALLAALWPQSKESKAQRKR